MGPRLALLLVAALGLALAGCSSDVSDTKGATEEIKANASKGGPEPSPNLPKPIGQGGGPQKSSDKFKVGTPGQ